MLPRGAETHSPTDVGVYARGPWAHLVEGTMEQTVRQTRLDEPLRADTFCPHRDSP